MRMFRMCDCEHARRRDGPWGDGKQAQQTTDMDRYGRADTTTADFSVTVYELIRHQGTYIARSLLQSHATDAIAILLSFTQSFGRSRRVHRATKSWLVEWTS